MKHTLLALALISTLGLAACERPAVVAVPVAPVVVPGPPGPAGTPGAPGATGAPGAAGAEGTGTTIIVTPPASAPAN